MDRTSTVLKYSVVTWCPVETFLLWILKYQSCFFKNHSHQFYLLGFAAIRHRNFRKAAYYRYDSLQVQMFVSLLYISDLQCERYLSSTWVFTPKYRSGRDCIPSKWEVKLYTVDVRTFSSRDTKVKSSKNAKKNLSLTSFVTFAEHWAIRKQLTRSHVFE